MALEILKITESGLKSYVLEKVPRKWERAAERAYTFYIASTQEFQDFDGIRYNSSRIWLPGQDSNL